MLARLEFEFGFLWPVSLALVLWTGWLCVRRYAVPTEGGGVEGGGRAAMLPLIRGLAMLLMAVMVLGPVWERPGAAVDAGTVAVVVDLGETMGVRDVQRPAAERLRLAMALGRYVDSGGEREGAWLAELGAVKASAEEVVAAKAAAEFIELTRADPTSARGRLQAARQQLADRVRVVAEAEGHPAAVAIRRVPLGGDEVGSRGWMETVQRRVSEGEQAVEAERLRRFGATVTEGSDGGGASKAAAEVAGMTRLEVARGLLGPGGALGELGSRPLVVGWSGRLRTLALEGAAWETASGSDLSVAVREVVSRSVRGGRRVRAVVVVSDGATVSGEAAVGVEGGGGMPVHTVWVAPAAALPGVRLASVEVPTRVGVGERAELVAQLRGVGVSGEVEVGFRAGGRTQSQRVRLGAEGLGEARFALPAEREGEVTLEVEVRAEGVVALGGRWAGMALVTAQRTRVVMMSGADGPGRDAVQLERWLRGRPLTEVQVCRAGEGPSELARADALVLSDVPAAEMTAGLRQSVMEHLRRGGTVLLLAGPSGLPVTWAADAELASWLPGGGGAGWVWWRSPSAEGSLVAVPATAWTEQAKRGEVWTRRPGVWRQVGVQGGDGSGVALLSDPATGRVLLSERKVGEGRVVMLQTDQSWRWGARTHAGDAEAEPWADVAGLVLESPYAVEASGVAMDVVERGGGLRVRVRSLRAEGSPGAMPGSAVVVRSGGRTVATGALRPAERASGVVAGRFVAEVEGLAAGEYLVQIEGREEPRLRVRVGNGGGMGADPSGRREGLAAWSAATGGLHVSAEDAAALAERLRVAPEAGELTRVTVRLWNSAGLAVVLLALLSGEWALRKHWGLA